jgi:hypothetical protein
MMAYDPRRFDLACFDLAEIFLQDEPAFLRERVDGLAQYIQDAIEDWIRMARADAEAQHERR